MIGQRTRARSLDLRSRFTNSSDFGLARLVREPFDLLVLDLAELAVCGEPLLERIRVELGLELPARGCGRTHREPLGLRWLRCGGIEYLTPDELSTGRGAQDHPRSAREDRLDRARRGCGTGATRPAGRSSTTRGDNSA